MRPLSGALEDKVEEVLVINAPFFHPRMRDHLIAAVNFVETLLAAEFTDALPAHVSAVEESRLVAQLFENRRGRSRQSAADDWLKVHKRPRKR